MDTHESPKTATKRWSITGGKFKMVIGGAAVLAISLLAGLVFTRYEASMPPENVPTEYMHVTISAQNLVHKADVMPASHETARSSTAPT
jgi:hypothetical protein